MVFVDLSAGPATERHLGLELLCVWVCVRVCDRDLRAETEVFAQSFVGGASSRYFPRGYKWRMRRKSSFSTWDPQVLGTHGVAIK